MVAEFGAVKEILQKYCGKNPVIFELGCYDGTNTSRMWDFCKGEPEHFFAFECDKRNIEKIKKWPHFPKNAVLVEKAVGDIDGNVELHLSDGNYNGYISDQSSSILKPKEHINDFPGITFEKIDIVKCIRLDTFCRQHNIEKIDLIFADIQGAEINMIKGLGEMLPLVKFMFLEKSGGKELYSGQIVDDDMKRLLSDTFSVYREFENDFLFYNHKLISL